MELSTLKDLFVHQLRDLYSAERQIVEALPEMIEAVTSKELRSALQAHLEETEGQVGRLEEIFESLEEKADGPKCKGMEGLLEEGEEILEEDADEDVRDAGIIAAAQRVEHYEIAGYGTAVTYAEMLDEDEAAELLGETLDEEKAADRKLTAIAKKTVNPKAKAGASAGDGGGSKGRGGKRKKSAA